ncbi:hypothetical protein FJZ26_00120 [Candidatus Parvarchaeota archaeon]|nr:hypothetical protein [Candidatus Parvarchaeota archaeon]
MYHGVAMGKISVPGKILFFGGFSVLEKGNPALCLAVCGKDGSGVVASWKKGGRRISSPQFGLDFEPSLEGLGSQGPLVSYPYLVCESYLKAANLWKNDVFINLSNSPIFGHKDEKTGLGSSAAATVAVARAVFEANGLDISPQGSHFDAMHKLSQLSYALYSGKIGSGFDIAACAFGKSIVYHRYDPSEIILPHNGVLSQEALGSLAVGCAKKKWGWLDARPLAYKKRFKVLFFNVLGGKTSTISSVKAVMQYKAADPIGYSKAISMQAKAENLAIKALESGNWETVRECTGLARQAHALLSSGASKLVGGFDAIEPQQLTEIIEECQGLDGIIAGRCPGAGGLDGVAFLARPDFMGTERIVEIGQNYGVRLEKIELKIL